MYSHSFDTPKSILILQPGTLKNDRTNTSSASCYLSCMDEYFNVLPVSKNYLQMDDNL